MLGKIWHWVWSRCWWPLWKQGTCTIRIAAGGPFESKEFYFTVAAGGPCKSKVVAHYNFCWGRCESKLLTHYICWWGPLWKQSTYTLQFPLGAPSVKFKSRVLVDKCSLGFLGFVRGTASLAERLGNINQTQIPNCTAYFQTLTNKNDHCACVTLHLNVWH